MAAHDATTHSLPSQEPESVPTVSTDGPFALDIERIAEEAESCCEFDPRGGPPVVVVNSAGASVITSTFQKKVFWAGVALEYENAYLLLCHIVRLSHLYPKASANLGNLVHDLVQAIYSLQHLGDGVAIVVNDTFVSPADLQRAKCEERGHLIQHGIEREARLRGCGFEWYEDLYDRPEAKLFVEGLKQRGNTLYDTGDRLAIVHELAMKMNNGKWRNYDMDAADAKAWATTYFREVRHHLGDEALLRFRPILIGRVVKAAFRDAVADKCS
jgi:hypothetical protein